MFEKITDMASKFPLENRRFSKATMVDAKVYVSCLAYISLADDSKIYDKLLFLCRLSHGMGLPMSSEDIFRMGLEIDEKYFDKACSELKDQKYSFLTDALILVNLTEEATEATFRLIADIARIFECEKEELRVAAMVAKAVLIEDFNVLKQIPVPSQNRWMGQFKEYIPDSWIRSQRVPCGEICTEQYKKRTEEERENMVLRYLEGTGEAPDNKEFDKKNPCVIKKRLNDGTVVKKGEELVLYEESVKRKKQKSNTASSSSLMGFFANLSDSIYETVVEKRSIYAPCDGIVFFAKEQRKSDVPGYADKFLEIYVVSYFDDYADFYEWHKKK